MNPSIKVFIVDDNEFLIKNLTRLLSEKTNFEIVNTSNNGQDLLNKLEENSNLPDVILMDIDMPIMNGFETTKQVKSKFPEIKILIFSLSDSEAFFQRAIHERANGFISKNEGIQRIIAGIKLVYENEFVDFRSA